MIAKIVAWIENTNVIGIRLQHTYRYAHKCTQKQTTLTTWNVVNNKTCESQPQTTNDNKKWQQQNNKWHEPTTTTNWNQNSAHEARTTNAHDDKKRHIIWTCKFVTFESLCVLKLYPVTSTGGTGTRGKEIWWRQGWHREMWKRNLVTSGGRIVTHGRKSIRLSHHLLSCHLFFIRCRVVFPKLLPCHFPFNGLVVFYCRFFCGFCFANNFSRVLHSNDPLETTTTPIR